MDTKELIEKFKKKLEDETTEQSKKTALIIDDSEINREILNFYLQEENFDTFFAFDGAEGIRTFQKIRPKFVFLDIVMPKMSGLDVLKEIKAIDPRAIVIMVSSYVSKHNVQKAKNLKADWFLMKPFTKEKLVEVIKRFEGR
jgi:two-component system chemotaxis response regulator CheY